MCQSIDEQFEEMVARLPKYERSMLVIEARRLMTNRICFRFLKRCRSSVRVRCFFAEAGYQRIQDDVRLVRALAELE
jgi:hypothetical protein